MKLLVVSHACATPLNQQLYAEVQRLTGWEIVIVVPSNWRDEYGRVCSAEQWSGFHGRVIRVPVRMSGNIILHTYRVSFAQLIREIQPDVVYVNHEPYAAATAQVYWGNARATGHRPGGFYSCQNILKRYPPPFRWTESWVFRSSAFAFPISSAVNEVLGRKGYHGISTVLPLAIDPHVHYPRPDALVARRELIGDMPSDELLVGYVGRLVPAKGLATLLNAAARVTDLPWRLLFVGAGAMEAQLREMAAELHIAHRVTFAGFIPHVQVPRVLSAMDVLVLPSETQSNWREQFGRVVLEAMACGAAVVGSDSGEIPLLISNTGGGLIFRERDPDNLAQALGRIIGDAELRRRLAAAGKAAVAARYTLGDAATSFATTIRTAFSVRSSSVAVEGVVAPHA